MVLNWYTKYLFNIGAMEWNRQSDELAHLRAAARVDQSGQHGAKPDRSPPRNGIGALRPAGRYGWIGAPGTTDRGPGQAAVAFRTEYVA